MNILFICKNADYITAKESALFDLITGKQGGYTIKVFEVEIEKKIPDFKDFDQIIFSQNHLNGFHPLLQSDSIYEQAVFNLLKKK